MFNITYLHTTCNIFLNTFIGSPGANFISTFWLLKWAWTSRHFFRMFFVWSSTLTQNMHQKLIEHGNFHMHNNEPHTKTLDELKNNSNSCSLSLLKFFNPLMTSSNVPKYLKSNYRPYTNRTRWGVAWVKVHNCYLVCYHVLQLVPTRITH